MLHHSWECEREHTRENTTWERGRRRSRGSVQICCIWLDSVQAGDWRLKRAWIDPKLGELVPYFEYFGLVSWFENWVSGASDLRVVLSALTAAVSEQSSFGRRTVWVGKRCPIELKFGGDIRNSCVYLSAKIGVVWFSGLRAVCKTLEGTEAV